MALTDTRWLVTEHGRILWRVRFAPEGVFHYTDPAVVGWSYWDTHPWCDNGRWSLNGALVQLAFKGTELVYDGVLQGGYMQGIYQLPSNPGARPQVKVWQAERLG